MIMILIEDELLGVILMKFDSYNFLWDITNENTNYQLVGSDGKIKFYLYEKELITNKMRENISLIKFNDIVKKQINIYLQDGCFLYFDSKIKNKDKLIYTSSQLIKTIVSIFGKKCNMYCIDSTDSFISILKETGLNDDNYYRGIANFSFELIPSLFRNKYLTNNEDIMYREFKNAFINELHNNSIIENLTTMQHYGLPTRLLDITTNPLVALYMVVNDVFNGKETEKSVGEVVIFDDINIRDVKYHDNNIVSVLAALSLLNDKDKLYLKKNIEKLTNDDPKIKELESIVKLDNPAFKMNFSDFNFLLKPIFIKPGMVNRRVDAQSGAFILFGLNEKYIEERYRKVMRLFIFNKELIRNELTMLGFSNKTMIPDMDYVAKFLKEKHSKKL